MVPILDIHSRARYIFGKQVTNYEKWLYQHFTPIKVLVHTPCVTGRGVGFKYPVDLYDDSTIEKSL